MVARPVSDGGSHKRFVGYRSWQLFSENLFYASLIRYGIRNPVLRSIGFFFAENLAVFQVLKSRCEFLAIPIADTNWFYQ